MNKLQIIIICNISGHGHVRKGRIQYNIRGSESPYSALDDLAALNDLFLCHHEWRRKPYDIAMCGLGEKAIVAQVQAQIPGCVTVWCVVDHDCIQ